MYAEVVTYTSLCLGRATASAFYPVPLPRAIREGMSDTEHSDQTLPEISKAEYVVSLLMSVSVARPQSPSSNQLATVSNDAPQSFPVNKLEPRAIPRQQGGTVPIKYELHDVKQVHLD